jgi:hypothetical protein
VEFTVVTATVDIGLYIVRYSVATGQLRRNGRVIAQQGFVIVVCGVYCSYSNSRYRAMNKH